MCRYLSEIACSEINVNTHITVWLFLGLYVENNNIQNNSRSKPNYKILYCSLKNMSLHGIKS